MIPKHPNGPDEVPFKTAVQKSADHLLMTIDGKPKEFGESKYTDIKNIFKNIQKCGYFDKAAQPPVTEANCAEAIVNSNDEVQPLEQDTAAETEIVPQDFHEAPAAANLPVPTFPPQPHLLAAPTPQIVQQVSLVQSMGPLVGMPRVNAPIPTTGQIHQHLVDVQAVEQGYFKNQYIRPIADVIGPGQGNFFFLQDSELDSPDVLPPGNYQQHQPQPPNSQISPNQAVTHQIPTQPPGVAPSQQQILPATQLATQTFNNQSFQNIVPQPMYTTKPIVDHIPGFVQPPVAVPLVPSTVVPNHQKEQSSQINTNQSQIHSNSSAPISFQPTNQQNMPKVQRQRGAKDSKQMKNDQRVPEITEWKPEDASKPPEEITEWRSQYTAVTDWNEETTEDSTWSNSNRYQYRNNGGGGGGNGSRERNNRGTRPGNNAGTNNYRNRQSNSYQSNGRQPGNGGDRGGNGNSFYRNDNFYSNGSYNKQDKQDGVYRGDNKQDGGFKGGSFRSRDSREQVNGSMRIGERNGPRTVRNGDSADRDRGSNRNAAQNSRPINKGGNSYGSATRTTAPTGNNTRPQPDVNA